MVLRGHCHGYRLLPHQQGAARPAPHLPGSHCTSVPFFFFFFPGKNLLTFRQAVLSVAFFLPAFISPFLPKALSKFVLAIDLIFSYLYDLCLHPSNSTYANVLQLVDRVHLRCSRLQLAQLPHPRSPGPRLRDQEGERVLHLPGFVSTCLPTPTERQTC